MTNDYPITICRSRSDDLTKMIIGLLMVLTGVALAMQGSGFTAMSLILAGGVVTVTSIPSLLDRSPVIVATEVDVWIKHSPYVDGAIPWANITGLDIKTIPRGGTFLALTVDGQGTFDVNISGLDHRSTFIYGLFQERLVLQPHYG